MKTNLTRISVLGFLSLLISLNTFAGDLISLTCGNSTSPAALTVLIKTGEFAPSHQKILQYDVNVSSKKFELESNMKVFDTDAQAQSFIETNPVVIPLTGSVLIVNAGKMTASWIDTVYEKIDELTCTK